MKILHASDLHLGSRMDVRPERAAARRREVFATFEKMIGYACEHGVRAIVLSGDVFDSDRPLKKDKTAFFSAVRCAPELSFFYLRGNHDSGTESEEKPDNLFTFSSSWTSYALENVTFTGLEMNGNNALTMYDSLLLDREAYNVVLLHGAVSDSVGEGLIRLSRFSGRNIDYLALGHYHSYASHDLDGRGRAVYAGCLEGRGWDETGEKGFVLLDTEKRTHEFVPFARRTLRTLSVDVSDAANAYEAGRAVRANAPEAPDDLLHVTVTGRVRFDASALKEDLTALLADRYYDVFVVDKTYPWIDAAAYAEEQTVRGELVRSVMADDTLSTEDKAAVCELALRVLAGGEVEI